MRVRVPVAGTIGKSVRINVDATVGAQIGGNLKLPDGKIPSLPELARALYAASPPIAAVTIESPQFVFESNIIDSTILARVADPETISGLWDFTVGFTLDGSNGLKAVTGQSGTVQTTGPGTNGDSGYSIDGKFSLITNSIGGFVTMFDDVNNRILWKGFSGDGRFEAYFGGAPKFWSLPGGMKVDQDIDVVTISHVSQSASTPVKQLVSKQRLETITGLWRFTTGPEIRSGATLTILSQSNVDFVTMTVDAIASPNEFNQVFTTVPIWNVTGLDKINFVPTLTTATGDEIAFTLDYTVNKATSGADTGLLIKKTDTASPGASLLIDAQVGGATKFSVDDTGVLVAASYSGILAANLLDKTAAETITESWIWSGSADTITFTGGGPFGIQFRSVQSTTAQQIDLVYRTSPDTLAFERTSDAVKIIEINAATLAVDFGATITAVSYDGILAANLLNKTAAEIVSGIWNFSADVGIRTASPGANLHVKPASGDATILLEAVSAGDPTLSLKAFVGRSSIINFIDNVGIGGRIIYDHANDEMKFFTVSTIPSNLTLVLDSSQNVGVGGTTSPAATLDVNGSILATSYGGILEANLLDKAAGETITGDWAYTKRVTLTGAGMRAIFTDETSTGTDVFKMQAGSGSPGFGGTLAMFAHSHATHPGSVEAGISSLSGGFFQVRDKGWVSTGTIVARIDDSGSLELFERAAARTNTAGYGQLWVKNTVPAQLWFTDDAGTDAQLLDHGSQAGLTDDDHTQYLLVDGSRAATVFNVTGALTAATYDGTAAANLLDKTAVETVSGQYTFTAARLRLERANPVRFLFKETDAALDEKVWEQQVSAARYILTTLNDALTAGNNALEITRTGIVVDQFKVLGSAFYANTTKVGFYTTVPVVKQTGVAVTAAAIHTALINLGLIAA